MTIEDKIAEAIDGCMAYDEARVKRDVLAIVREALADKKEACARVADKYAKEAERAGYEYVAAAEQIADLIRSGE